MMLPSVASLAPDRPGAEADPEMNEPPCTLYSEIPVHTGSGRLRGGRGGGTYHTKTGRLAVSGTLSGV
jgi:hypothetical protein